MGMVFLAAAVILGLIGGYFGVRAYIKNQPKAAETNDTPSVATTKLSQAELDRLTANNVEIGGAGNLLTFSANSNFTGKVNIASDTTLSGNLTGTGTGSFTNLNAPGTANFGNANVGSNLKVTGATALQGNINAASGLNVGGNLSVAGASSFAGRLNAGSLAARDATFNGSVTVNGHYVSQGATPFVSAGGNIGSGGTVSVSGNDTAGSVVINAGTGATGGTLATVGFRTGYRTTPRISLTPTSETAAALQYYVIRTTSGFTIRSLNAPSGSASFDYFVSQ
jgi:cytoskeletal protein CcmA (bactofilin family)